MDKAQAMRLHACLPDSYWEFAILHAAHVYNMTPMNRLNWRTPLELLKREKLSRRQVSNGAEATAKYGRTQ
jgi:hypothetical protein